MHFSKTLPLDMPMPVLLTDVVSTLDNDSTSPPRPVSTLSPSTLSPSLLSDLKRFGDAVCETDLLPVLAASIRHVRPLTMHLHHGDRIISLSVFPREQQFHCNIDVCALPGDETSRLRLVHIGPVVSAELQGLVDLGAPHIGALAPLLWQLTLRGCYDDLLPEIAGPARYRLAPGPPLRYLPLDPWSLPMLKHLRHEATTLEELAPRTAVGRARARRLLNAIYLQGRLMITRSLSMRRRASSVRKSAR